MIPIHVEIVNLPRVDAEFARIDSGVSNLRSLWGLVGDEFYAQEKGLFDAAPWVPLSPSYAEQKRKEFGDKPILRATDTLFRSLTQEGAEGNVHRVDALSAEFGSSDFKAMLHHTGTSRMPIRDPLAKPDEDKYLTIIGEYMDKLVQEAVR